MRRACICLLLGLFALILSSNMAAAQDTKWVRDKETGERVKVKKSGDKWKVKDTGKKYKVKESKSGAKVKKTGAKVRFEERRGEKKEKKATPTPESVHPRRTTEQACITRHDVILCGSNVAVAPIE